MREGGDDSYHGQGRGVRIFDLRIPNPQVYQTSRLVVDDEDEHTLLLILGSCLTKLGLSTHGRNVNDLGDRTCLLAPTSSSVHSNTGANPQR